MHYDLELSYTFIDRHPVEAAQIFERLSFEAAAGFLNTAPASTAASVLKAVNPLTASQVLGVMVPSQTASICQTMPLGMVSALLRRLDPDKRQKLMEALPADFSTPLQRVLHYSEGTAGALMKTRILVLPDDITVAEGLERLRRHPEQIFDYTYIVNRNQGLVGFVNVRHLMLAQPETKVSAVMKKTIGRLRPQMGRKAILTHPGWRTGHALPVVDENEIFLGAVSYQTLRQLENEVEAVQPDARGGDAGKALGELYWLGISAFLKGAAAAIEGDKKSK
jgi:magnesium transporter